MSITVGHGSCGTDHEVLVAMMEWLVLHQIEEDVCVSDIVNRLGRAGPNPCHDNVDNVRHETTFGGILVVTSSYPTSTLDAELAGYELVAVGLCIPMPVSRSAEGDTVNAHYVVATRADGLFVVDSISSAYKCCRKAA